MIIRHAEKPSEDSLGHGVSVVGAHDKHGLCVRGWQRAGALVRFFAPHSFIHPHPLISKPRTIFASAATFESPSLRSQHTVDPLAVALGLRVETSYPCGDEHRLAAAVKASAGPVLIAWHHRHIPKLARAIAGQLIACPAVWPDDRFDLVWVLDQPNPDEGWRFFQIGQNLLPHDLDEL
jgi:hypothetical protein